mmetsp:Transcript_23487/g.51528  ORF Transcript_23487/g.51528 Transcript_23487/m.51528 type:complete len:169 (+) Transcript_23487:91-597(+)|eukprot:CAMPEP_0206449086 /NCGR_PEP_ID=MMETSP0324_2-20121206/17878_1 /ASSEMBLY_ACC=CAM_ASM_000836 /TAXON_ID=2866 /ORGANISM="Crypthecodinium cohnii, Strain Seligo" /LENGTH=168 /DNA_ID=CAMNT_0053918393 /DNA_START=96 /DNA_END=602 /DNA_ORIENTATION=-
MLARTVRGVEHLRLSAALRATAATAAASRRSAATTAPATATGSTGGSSSSSSAAARPMETWEEVELHRPKAPTLEGYVKPAGAPEQFDIPREQYHQFMLGKPARYSVELRNFLMGLAVVSFCFAEFAFTIYKLKPDDMDWIDEERQRAAAAKARIEAKIAAKEGKTAE